jgi:hypothetical protein
MGCLLVLPLGRAGSQVGSEVVSPAFTWFSFPTGFGVAFAVAVAFACL